MQARLVFAYIFASVGLDEWFGDTANAKVLKECKNIDIYITNGTRHIIIENKIRAGDAPNQLARYIETIHNPKYEGFSDELSSENAKIISYENIAVIYLSPYGKAPSSDSLALKEKGIQWKAKENAFEFNKQRVEYRQISYKEHIMQWIEKCQTSTNQNLNSAFDFYKEIVQIITNLKGDEMSVEAFLKQKREFIAVAAKIKKIEIEQICVEFFEQEVASKPEFSEWEFIDKGIAFGFCPKKYLNQRFKFILALEKINCSRYLGFRLYVNGEFENKDLPKRLKAIVEKQGFKLNSWGWWLVDENGKDMVDLTSESLNEYFLRHYEKVNALNDFLYEQEKQSGSEIAKLASEVKN